MGFAAAMGDHLSQSGGALLAANRVAVRSRQGYAHQAADHGGQGADDDTDGEAAGGDRTRS